MSLESTISQLYNLKRDKQADHERPHKPLLLLTILDLIESGQAKANQIHLTENLITWWKDYFEIVKASNDKPTLENPLFAMAGDGFWRHQMNEGFPPLYVPGNVRRVPSMKNLREKVAWFSLDELLWDVFATPEDRELCRSSLISRYFSKHTDLILAMSHQHCDAPKQKALYRDPHAPSPNPMSRIAETPARKGAFRNTVISVYEHQCAACGLRVRTAKGTTLVDAAHLIPFKESYDDSPANGMALCKNHHWAMDQHLIAPGPDLKWHASPHLDDRQDGQAKLIALDGRDILLPKEKAYFPREASLTWRQDKLQEA